MRSWEDSPDEHSKNASLTRPSLFRATSLSVPSRSLRRRRSRTAPSRNGLGCALATPFGAFKFPNLDNTWGSCLVKHDAWADPARLLPHGYNILTIAQLQREEEALEEDPHRYLSISPIPRRRGSISQPNLLPSSASQPRQRTDTLLSPRLEPLRLYHGLEPGRWGGTGSSLPQAGWLMFRVTRRV